MTEPIFPVSDPCPGPSDEVLRRAASELYGRDGELEFDDDAKISRGDEDGAYVQCWRWIYYEDVVPFTS
jgi:hypothetical protein